jgi:hypothetical protein
VPVLVLGDEDIDHKINHATSVVSRFHGNGTIDDLNHDCRLVIRHSLCEKRVDI